MRPDRGMELHHKLRRDPSWHPNSCNICGQLGHQAANCTTGTINWRQIYGDDAFTIKPPVYWSDIVKKQQERAVNLNELEKKARGYARMQCQAQGVDYDAMMEGVQNFQTPQVVNPMQQSQDQNKPMKMEGQDDPMQGVEAAGGGAPPLPEGWALAHDPQGRVYYWHKRTQKVQWERPTEQTVP